MNRNKSLIILGILLLLVLCTACKNSSEDKASEDVAEEQKEQKNDEAEINGNINLYASDMEIADGFAGGSGTESDPYRIQTAEQMALLSYILSDEGYEEYSYDEYSSYLNGYYVLDNDIYLNDISDFDNWLTQIPQYQWKPINGKFSGFQGIFDGQGHSIYGMYIYKSDIESDSIYTGLFANAKGAEIKNLNIKNSLINIDGKADYIGGLIGDSNETKILSCDCDVKIYANGGDHIGGIVSWIDDGNIEDSTFSGEIILGQDYFSGTKYVGGLTASVVGISVISNCESKGKIVTAEDCDLKDFKDVKIGGLISNISGWTYEEEKTNIKITDSVNSMDFDIGYVSIGGIVNTINSDMGSVIHIENCRNDGNISNLGTTEYEGTGGIVASLLSFNDREDVATPDLQIISCTNNGDITSSYSAGGIVGESNMGNSLLLITDCENNGVIKAETHSGGIVGEYLPDRYDNIIERCNNNGEILSESSTAGGIIGHIFGFSLYVTTDSITAPYIHYCTNSGAVCSESGMSGTGGIVGSADADKIGIVIDTCLNEGEIKGDRISRIGGIIGSSSFALTNSGEYSFIITNCVNTGILSSGNGLVEYTEKEDISDETPLETINEADAIGLAIASCPSIGGIAGTFTNGVIENSINTGKLFIDSEANPVNSRIDVGYYVKNGDGKGLIAIGAITGGFYSINEDGSEDYEDGKIIDCYYINSIPNAVCDFRVNEGGVIMTNKEEIDTLNNKINEQSNWK